MRQIFYVLFVFMLSLTAAMAQGTRQDDGRSQVYHAPDAFDFEAQEAAPQGSALPQYMQATDNENRDPVAAEEVLSPIEAMYADRVINAPRQFGYEMFAQESDDLHVEPMGAVQDDYVLGIGDDLSISFSGQRNTRENAKIDRQGMLVIEDFPPLAAAGLTLAQVRKALEERALSLHNTQVYVTMGSVRQIGVLVVGNVNKPGRYSLTVFNTVLDALMRADGVMKGGSLRQIKLVRGGESRLIDLYDVLLLGGVGQDITLRDGDRVVVPPIGATVMVSGAVKRPGIYEIRSDPFKGLLGKSKNRLSLREMLSLGGGVLSAGQNRFMNLSVRESGYEVGEEVTDEASPVFGDGAILVVARGKEKKSAQIQLLGQTRKAGLYDLGRHANLSSVLNDPQVLGEDIYPLIGVIARWDPERLTTKYLNYPVRAVLKKEKDFTLEDGDKIYFFSTHDIYSIFPDSKNGENGFDKEEKKENFLKENPALVSYLKERSVVVRGAVRQEGFYPVADSITLDDVLAAAGGLSRDADQSNIEITSTTEKETKNERRTIDILGTDPKTEAVRPGDAVRVMQKFRKMEEKGVLIVGQVAHPGRYDLLPQDKISDLIKRAGGLTAQAYPAGAVFSRESERRAEEARFKAAKQDIERSLGASLQKEKGAPDAAQIQMVRDLADQLGSAKALGRITIEASPDMLAMKPELDMLLEDGDKLYIPKRPLTVRVSGEVLSPASLQFVQAKDPLEYIRQAGGFTYHADKNRTFVLYPDGSAQPLKVSTWNHKPIMIPPGSSIIVPRDPKPFDFMESARDVTQIISNLAVTSILVDDLQD